MSLLELRSIFFMMNPVYNSKQDKWDTEPSLSRGVLGSGGIFASNFKVYSYAGRSKIAFNRHQVPPPGRSRAEFLTTSFGFVRFGDGGQVVETQLVSRMGVLEQQIDDLPDGGDVVFARRGAIEVWVILLDGDGSRTEIIQIERAERTELFQRLILRTGVDDDHVDILPRRRIHLEQTAILDGVAAAVVQNPLGVLDRNLPVNNVHNRPMAVFVSSIMGFGRPVCKQIK